MARPSQLLAVTLVYTLGTLMAKANGYQINPLALIWGYLAIIPVSASIHYANEYADHETDALTQRTPFSGGSGVLPQTGLPPRIALTSAWVALLLGAGIAALGFFIGLLELAALVTLAFGAFFGWMYSVGPFALAWKGWGELDNALLGGVALPVYSYAVQAGQVDYFVILASIPFGTLVFINLLATTWPDRVADAAVGKRTLATRWSVKRLRRVYVFAGTGSFIAVLVMVNTIFPVEVIWGSLLALPVAVWGAYTYTQWHSPFPTVAAMAVMLLGQIAGWGLVVELF
ncbi:MAG: prenyltransferase [Chloroflexi bacterium]|nr:prenyltransferase [Chloroflexota bacterium]